MESPPPKRLTLPNNLDKKDVFYYHVEPDDQWRTGKIRLHALKGTDGNDKAAFMKSVIYRKLHIDDDIFKFVKATNNPHVLTIIDYFNNPPLKLQEFKSLCIVEKGQPDFLSYLKSGTRSVFETSGKIRSDFREEIRGLIMLVSHIHGLGITHGNIIATSVWKVDYEHDKFRLKLNMFEGLNSNLNMEDRRRTDWLNLSDLFQSWSSKFQHTVEYDDMCNYIKKLVSEGNTVQTMEKRLLAHPIFWNFEKVDFVPAFFNYMKAKDCSWLVDLDLKRMSDSWIPHMNEDLFKYLKSTAGYDVYLGHWKSDLIRFTRHGMEHLQEMPKTLKAQFPTRESILNHVLSAYPELIIELWNFASTHNWLKDVIKFF